MPNNVASPEMQEFAAQFGGVVAREGDTAFGKDPCFDTAFAVSVGILNDFEGMQNGRGEVFSYDLQLIDNMTSNAVCGKVGERYCIGVYVGLLQKILEIATLVIESSHDGKLTPSNERVLSNAGFDYLQLLQEFSIESHTNFLRERIFKKIQNDQQKFLYITNSLMLFVLIHEIRHATDGHAQYSMERFTGEGISYLGETESKVDFSDARIPLLMELDADADSFFTIVGNIFKGKPLFHLDEIDSYDQIRLFWIGVLLLANTWALAEDAKAPCVTHPPAIHRILSLSMLLLRPDFVDQFASDFDKINIVGRRFDNLHEMIAGLYDDCATFSRKLVQLDDGFVRVALGFSDVGGKAYLRLMDEVYRGASIAGRLQELITPPRRAVQLGGASLGAAL